MEGNKYLQMDALLVLPSTPSLPPIKSAKSKELEIFESRALSMLSIASMGGCCQVSSALKLPWCQCGEQTTESTVNCMILPWL